MEGKNTLYQRLMAEREKLVFDDVIEFPEYSEIEKKVALHMQKIKNEFLENYEKNPHEPFLTRGKFGESKERIQNTRIYKILKKFPKFGLLHIHMVASLPSKVLYEMLKEREDGYIYTGAPKKTEDGILLKPYGVARLIPPQFQQEKEAEGWSKVQKVRKEYSSPEDFDKFMLQKFYFGVEDDEGSSEKRWLKFQSIFPLIMYYFHVDVHREFYFKMIESFVNDGIYYAELSTMLGSLYDSEGKIYSPEEHLIFLKELDDEAKRRFPTWQGGKIRHEDHKGRTLEEISKTLDDSVYLQTKYPGFCVGFDLVGEEDGNRPTKYFMPLICEKLEEVEKKNQRLEFLFHAGESNRMNNNIIDVLLLKTNRIGHGFNLFSSKKAMDMIRRRNIEEEEDGGGVCLEICPVSNRTLGYVFDGRLHPLTSYIRNNIPFVISSDDPGVFNYEGVTFDYFFVMVGNLNFGINDLNVLKMIAKNSIKYSRMNKEEKERSYQFFEKMYQIFLNEVMEMME